MSKHLRIISPCSFPAFYIAMRKGIRYSFTIKELKELWESPNGIRMCRELYDLENVLLDCGIKTEIFEYKTESIYR